MRYLFLLLLLILGCERPDGEFDVCSIAMSGMWEVPEQLEPMLSVSDEACMFVTDDQLMVLDYEEFEDGPEISCENDKVELDGYGKFKLTLDDGTIHARSTRFTAGFDLEPCYLQ